MDGFDEMPSSIVCDESSLIMELIRGDCLPKATRLVTSRPSALHKIKVPYRHIEILGFTDECKVKFAEATFKSEPDVLTHFKNFIFSNPIIESLMYIPVNCAIIAQVYKDIKRSRKLMPKTMTQLYTTLILVLIRRHMIEKKKWDEDSKIPNNLNDLPDEIITDLKGVSELAYRGLLIEGLKIVFTDSDVGEGFQHLGLLSETKEMYVEGAKSSYSFLHLSIQEFLAAWHVSCHQDLLEVTVSKIPFHEHLIQSLSWHNMEQLHNMESFGQFLSGTLNRICHSDIENDHTSPFMLKCFYEAQVPSILGSLHFTSSCQLGNPLDMYIFGYCLVHAPIVWNLRVETSFDMLVSSIADWLPANGRILGSFADLTIYLSQHFSALENLPKYILEPMTCLYISSITQPVLPALISVISLLHVLENATFFFSEQCPDEYLLYSALKCISSLKKLNLDFGCGVTTKGVQELSKFFSFHCTLEHLSVTCNSAGEGIKDDVKMQGLVKAALSSSSLKSLSFNVPYIFHSLPNNIEEIVFKVSPHSRMAISRLFDCLSSIADLGKQSWVKHLDMGGNIYLVSVCQWNVPSKMCCDLLALLNNNLHSNPSLNLSTSFLSSFMPPVQLNSLSHALCKDPDIPRLNLRRSKSLCDLTTVQIVKRDNCRGTHHSCPDLLELQALHDMHPKLQKAHFPHHAGTFMGGVTHAPRSFYLL